jgi:hypothetical protein
MVGGYYINVQSYPHHLSNFSTIHVRALTTSRIWIVTGFGCSNVHGGLSVAGPEHGGQGYLSFASCGSHSP